MTVRTQRPKAALRKLYVQEWAVKAHRNASDVYVPESLQPDRCFSCGWHRHSIPQLLSGRHAVDGPGNHRNCSEGRW